MPTSWSWLSGYRRIAYLRWQEHDYRLVQPWLDHPPGYPLFMGLWMRAAGVQQPLYVGLRAMRASSVVLALVQLALFAALARRLLPQQPHAAALAIFFLAVAPPAVIHQRLAVSEALWVPLGLAAYLVLLAGGGRRRLAALAGLAASLLVVKLTAVAFLAFLFLAALRRGDRRAALALVAGGLAGFAAYAAWGIHLDRDVFRLVMQAHGGRFSGFDAFERLLTSSRQELDRPYLPFLLGAAFAGLQAFGSGGTGDWRLAIPAYVLSLGLLANENEIYPWYRLPMYPFMALGLGTLVAQAWRRRQPLGIALLGAALLVELAITINGAGLLRTPLVRAGLAVLLLGCLVVGARRRASPALAQWGLAAILSLQVVISVLRVALWVSYSDQG